MALNGALGLGINIIGKDLLSPAVRAASRSLQQFHHAAKAIAAERASGGVGGLLGAVGFGGKGGGGAGQGRDDRGRFTAKSSGLLGGGAGFGALGLGKFLGGGAILGGLRNMVDAAGEFEQKMEAVFQIAQASPFEKAQLSVAAMRAGLEGFDPSKAAESLADLASAGFNASDSAKLLGPTMALAASAMGQLTTSQAGAVTAQALTAFGLSADQAAPTVDKLVKTMNLFAVQAKDLPLGLANTARGANAMNQSLDETMIAFGLVRNIMPRTESAATAVSRAMERLADTEVQTTLKGLGVEVVDSEGKFRKFLDIVGDMTPHLNKMTEAERASFLQQTFGKTSLVAFNAILKQTNTGIKTSSGQLLKGADAFAYLRKEMEESEGTAKKFRDGLMGTLPGQFQLLGAVLKTGAVSLGKPLAETLKPIVTQVFEAVRDGVASFEAMSPRAKRAIAGIVMAVGLLGASLLLVGAPVTLLIAGIVGGLALIKRAYDTNFAGFGDKARSAFESVKLIWSGLVQVFTQGGFSGGVLKELNKAENSGIKQFVITAFVWISRLKNFFSGLGEGFSSGLAAAQPAFDAMGAALSRLGEALGITTKNDPSSNATKWSAWGKAGQTAGELIAGALGFLASIIEVVSDVATGFISSFDGFGPLVDSVKTAIDDLTSAFGGMSDATENGRSGWQILGAVIGSTVSFALALVGAMVRGVSGAILSIRAITSGLAEFLSGVFTADWARAWNGIKQITYGVIKAIMTIVGNMVEVIASGIDAVMHAAGRESDARGKVSGFMKELDASLKEDLLDQTPAERDKAAKAKAFAGADAAERANAQAKLLVAGPNPLGLTAAARGFRSDIREPGVASPEFLERKGLKAPPVNLNTKVQLVVDGQVLADTVAKFSKEAAARGGDAIDIF